MIGHELTSLAKQVVERFFQTNEALNDIIRELVAQRDMNEHMIRRLCEMVNTETRLRFYRTPGINQAAALFEPADAAKIIIIKKEIPEDESIPLDYMIGPKYASVKSEAIKIDPPKPKEKPIDLEEKKAHVIMRYSEYTDARNAFLREVKNYLRDEGDAVDINKMASFIDGQNTLRKMFPHIEDFLGKLKMQKEASEIKDLINTALPITYVYGNHPLVLKYKDCVVKGKSLEGALVEYEETNKKKMSNNEVEKTAGVGGALLRVGRAAYNFIRSAPKKALGTAASTAGNVIKTTGGGGFGTALTFGFPTVMGGMGTYAAIQGRNAVEKQLLQQIEQAGGASTFTKPVVQSAEKVGLSPFEETIKEKGMIEGIKDEVRRSKLQMIADRSKNNIQNQLAEIQKTEMPRSGRFNKEIENQLIRQI